MYFFDSMDFAFPKGSATSNLQMFNIDTWYTHYYMNDFVFVNNPDGTLGVYYDQNKFTGTTNNIQNFSSQINEGFCNILSNKFDETRNELITAFYAGENQLPDCYRSGWPDACSSETFATFFQNYTYRSIPTCYWDKRRNVCATKTNPIDTACCGDDFTIDFNSLLTEPITNATTNEKFDNFLTTELIDVKNRKTLSGYPTIRALYDRYMDSTLYTGVKSSAYDYSKMDGIANMVGTYWVDIVEQVIPATTIWGSTKIYSNTMFDQQKFMYKKGSLFTCTDNLNTSKIPIQNLDWLNSCMGNVIDKFYMSGCTTNVPCNINKTFGYLYNWYAATDIKNIANPDGGNGQTNLWHLPSDTEFATLSSYLGGDAIAGGKLKTTGTVEGLDGCWYAPNSGATNLYSFDGMPGGRRHYTTGVFANLGNYANYWTSTINFAPNAFFVTLLLNQEYTVTTSANYNWGIAVRLVRDASVSEQLLTDGTNSIDNPTTLDPYIGNDGKVYKTTKIGTQIWLSQDLLETKFNDLSNITEIINDVDWNGLTTAARATYTPVSICATQNCN